MAKAQHIETRKIVAEELRKLEKEGLVVQSVLHSTFVSLFYKAEYLGSDPDNGWNRATGERMATIVDRLAALGCTHETSQTFRPYWHKGCEVTDFILP